MEEKKLRIIILLASIAVLGLIAIQFYWISNALNLEKEKFNKNVGSALSEIVETLEKNETAEIMVKEISNNDSNNIVYITKNVLSKSNVDTNKNYINKSILINDNHDVDIDYKITSSDSVKKSVTVTSSLTKPSKDSIIKSIVWIDNQDSLIHQRTKIIENVFDNLIIADQEKQITERCTKSSIDSLCHEIFPKYGINAEFKFNILNENEDTLLYEVPNIEKNNIKSSHYKARLFPNSIFTEPHFLLVNFFNRKIMLMSSVWLIITISGLLTLLIVIVFYQTIKMFLNQKKIAETRNDLLTNISHEFKTPISTITLAADLLNEMGTENSTKHLNIIRQESNKLTSMVENVLTTASLEKDNYVLTKKKVNLHNLLLEVIEPFKLTVNELNGSIFTQFNASNSTVFIDDNKIKTVFTNIIDNAIKYNLNTPEIIIETNNINNEIVILIKDNGIGIEEQNIPKIFDAFFRVPTGNIHNIKGSGVGLSIAKKIIDAHNGKIEITSIVNKGTTIKIFFQLNNE